MKRCFRGAILIVGAAMGWQAPAMAGPAGAAVHTVVIDGMLFVPANLKVKAGDTVIWKNKDSFPHTATTEKKGFDSGSIAAGGSWKFVAARRGKFAYLCTLHRTMKGTVTVE